MIKDILKIIKIYLKNYMVPIMLLLVGFALFTTISSSNQLSALKHEIANYEFEKNIGIEEERKIEELSNYTEKEEKMLELENKHSNYIANYDGEISKESFEYLLHRYAVGAYLNEYRTQVNPTFYSTGERELPLYGAFNKRYEHYLTKEEKDNAEKYISLGRMEPGSKSYLELNRELSNIYPPVFNRSQGKIATLANENLGENRVEVKETLYSTNVSLGYYVLITLIAILIFGAEYHTNFGKFIASLPFKRERVYFAKLILGLLVLMCAAVVVGFVNVFVIKASVLGGIYSPLNAFMAQMKVFSLGISLILIGAILASFCGSVLSIGALYFSVVGLFGYFILPAVLVLHAIGKEALLDKVDLTGVDNYIPLFYYFKYVETKYIAIWFLVLFLLTFFMSYVYKYHRVEREGRFFTIPKMEVVGYVVLLIGVVSFSLILFKEIFNLNLIVILIISVIVLPYLLWKIMKFKIRI